MTPAINLLKKHKVAFQLHEYAHDPSVDSYGEEAAQLLSLPAKQIFKTLVVELEDGKLAVGIVPVDGLLSVKSIARHMGHKKAKMADKDAVARSSGYVLGGVSPLGQKRLLPTVIDNSAKAFATMLVSGGRRGLDIELAPTDLARLCKASFGDIATD